LSGKKIPRRKFLEVSISAAGVLAFDSCAVLEGAFHQDRRVLDKEVVIVGGGLAGLTAAYTLKQSKIPFRLFEADREFGGRVQSKQLGSTRQIIELGGESISPQHQNVLSLSKELGLKVHEVSREAKPDQFCFYWQNRFWTFAEVKKQSGNFFPLAEKIRGELLGGTPLTKIIYNPEKVPEMAEFYSKISLRSLGDKYAEKMGPVFIAYLQAVVENHFAQSGENISVFEFIKQYFGEAGQDFWFPPKRSFLRVDGGNQNICKSLSERVSGVIPQHLLRSGMALTQIHFKDPRFVLKMEDTRTGASSVYETKHLILALPLSCLQKVMGFADLPIRSSLRAALQSVSYSQHSNLFWGLKEKSSKLGNLSRIPIFSTLNNSCLQLSSGMLPGRDQVVRSYRANGFGRGLSLQDSLAELEIMNPGIRNQLNSEADIMDWGQRVWSLGSFAHFKVGDFFRSLREFHQGDFTDSLVFAGEHTSLNYGGTMEGAVESGKIAAEKMIQRLSSINNPKESRPFSASI